MLYLLLPALYHSANLFGVSNPYRCYYFSCNCYLYILSAFCSLNLSLLDWQWGLASSHFFFRARHVMQPVFVRERFFLLCFFFGRPRGFFAWLLVQIDSLTPVCLMELSTDWTIGNRGRLSPVFWGQFTVHTSDVAVNCHDPFAIFSAFGRLRRRISRSSRNAVGCRYPARSDGVATLVISWTL